MSSSAQTYSISDFVEWAKNKQLVLDAKFQRGKVWTPQARSFLIDTILRQYPIPSVYIRTRIDAASKKSIREAVDGQQRLRAILDFAGDELRVTGKGSDWSGKRYSELGYDLQEQFLSYNLSTVQLVNASDADVLEIFARLNSYSVKVTPAELRHAEFDTPMKWAIWNATREWPVLWQEFSVVSIRDSVRLKNTSLMAECFMVVLAGFGDGGEDKITRFYRSTERVSDGEAAQVSRVVSEIISFIVKEFGPHLKETTFFSAPNFLVLFAACAFLRNSMPDSRITESVAEFRGKGVDVAGSIPSLQLLAEAVEDEIYSDEFSAFVSSTKSTTQRFSTRQPRFEQVVRTISR